MSDRHDFKAYKRSLSATAHLEAILYVLSLSKRGLYPFRAYRPVAKILLIMEEEYKVLAEYYEKFKIIKETKGKIKQ